MFTREYVLTGEEMARADRYTRSVLGIPSIVLMERAAVSAARIIQQDYAAAPFPVRVAVIAGKGNNGADALAAGRILLDAGFCVSFYLTFPLKSASPSPLCSPADGALRRSAERTSLEIQLHILEAYGAAVQPLTDDLKPLTGFCPQVIIDGIFGTGLSRRVEGIPAKVISCIRTLRRDMGARVYAMDLPSGICAGTGAVLGTATEADVTVAFAFYKRGHFLYPGCSHCGRTILCPIGITPRSLEGESPAFTFRWQEGDTLPSGMKREALLPPRRPDGNKGTFGKVLVIAGSKGVCGACILCAQAALRSGAGMVRIFTHASNRVILQETVPEAMCTVYERAEEVEELLAGALDWADVAAAGPGIGLTEAGEAMLRQVLAWGSERSDPRRGLVLDADALRLLARHGLYDGLRAAAEQSFVILTPHPGEGAALLHTGIQELQEHAEERYTDFVRRYRCTVLAKDARTRVFAPDNRQVYLNTTGNDGLATAGSGDVLAGITAGFLAQERDLIRDAESPAFAAACAAACLHGRLAERYAAQYAAGALTASDLIRLLPSVLSDVQSSSWPK